MKIIYTKQNIIQGALIFALGDGVASLIINEFSIWRVLGMLFIGGTFYAIETPNFFAWIDRYLVNRNEFIYSLKKSLLAVLFFNPLWIGRHFIFIKLFLGDIEAINYNLLVIAFWSFLYNIPASFLANHIIQNKIKLEHRFFASAIFSGIMALYYAFSTSWFS